MNILWLDLETYSTIDLRKAGSYKYAENCEILLMSYAWNDGPVSVHDFTVDPEFPEDCISMLLECDAIGAHNGILFDRIVLKKSKYGHIIPDDILWRDTMVRAYSHSLPGGLGLLCDIFDLSEDEGKKKEGKNLVQLFCKPQGKGRKIKRATRKTHPAEWERFKEYAKNDIIAMRLLDKKIPKWNETKFERDLQLVDMRMNDRGFKVDLDFCMKAIEILEKEKDKRDARIADLTDNAVGAATQRDMLLKYILEAYDVELPDMKKSTLQRRLDDENLPDTVKELIALRLQSAGTSTSKYQSIIDMTCADGRVKGTQQFRGAHRTGRWGGRGFQPHNLPRPQFKFGAISDAIDMIKLGGFDYIKPESSVSLLSSCVRSIITASDGDKLGVADLSSIEGRGLAYLAGEKWKLKAYEDYDAGIGYDLYVLTYAMTFGCEPESVTKDQRQLGKVLELAMGYGGGVGAFITFGMAYGVDLDKIADEMYDRLPDWEKAAAENWWYESLKKHKTYRLKKETFVTLDTIKRMWRAANPATVKLWRDLEDAFKAVLMDKDAGRIQAGRLWVDKKGSWVRIQLPSGRYLSYPGAKLVDDGKKVTYLGLNIYSRKWCNIKTYGGKLAENVTQAFAADVFGHGLVLADREGFMPVLGVHDEQVSDMPEGKDVDGLIKCMSTVPEWAEGLPLSAAGFESYRYRKD